MSVAAAVGFPKWVLLESFVFVSRLDDGESFPDEALIRASGTTSWGAHFRIAFSLAEPPLISRLYAQLPEPGILTKSSEGESLHILATHRHLALLVLDITKSLHSIQNLVIFRADEKPSLKALPPCYEPRIDYYHRDNDLHYLEPPNGNGTPRVLEICYLGLWCGEDKEEEFVVAEMDVYVPGDRTKAFTDMCLLRSSYTDDQLPRRKWRTMRVEIILSTADRDPDQLWWWVTETVIPFRRWLCWIDYHRGMLLCDMSRLRRVPTPTVSFLRFPLDEFPSGTRSATCSFRHRGVSVVDHGRLLKFVNVARHDGLVDGALKPGTGFTITCHTLDVDSMTWKKDYSVTSDDILNFPDSLRCSIPLFPQVNIDRPHVVHFVMLPKFNNMWVGCIDMSTKTVESFSLYMDGTKFQPADGTEFEFMMQLYSYPRPFLPCEFPRFCYLSRKRKDME